MEIDVYMDHVVIERQTVKRPSYITRNEWIDRWSEYRLNERRKKCPECLREWWE